METVEELKQILSEKQCKLNFLCGELKQLQRKISNRLDKKEYGDFSVRNAIIMELCCDMQWNFYPDVNLTVFSHSYQKITGWPQFIYDNLAEVKKLIHPQDLNRLEEQINEILRGRIRAFTSIFRYGCADKTYLLLNSFCIAQRDKNDKIVSVLGFSNLLTDVSADNVLMEREKPAGSLPNSFMMNYIWEYDLKKIFFSVNDEFMKLFRLTYNKEFYRELQQLLEGIEGNIALERKVTKVIRLKQQGTSHFLLFKVVYYVVKDREGGLYKLVGTIKGIDNKTQRAGEISDPC